MSYRPCIAFLRYSPSPTPRALPLTIASEFLLGPRHIDSLPPSTQLLPPGATLQMVLLFPPPARARVTPMSVWVAQDGPNVCTGGREASRHGGRDACPVRPGGWRPFGCCGGADPPPPAQAARNKKGLDKVLVSLETGGLRTPTREPERLKAAKAKNARSHAAGTTLQ